jgi:hypothetical protein
MRSLAKIAAEVAKKYPRKKTALTNSGSKRKPTASLHLVSLPRLKQFARTR